MLNVCLREVLSKALVRYTVCEHVLRTERVGVQVDVDTACAATWSPTEARFHHQFP